MDRGLTDLDHSKSKGKGKVMTYYYCDKECHFKKDRPKRKDLAKEEESKLDNTTIIESSDGEVTLLSLIKVMDHTTDF